MLRRFGHDSDSSLERSAHLRPESPAGGRPGARQVGGGRAEHTDVQPQEGGRTDSQGIGFGHCQRRAQRGRRRGQPAGGHHLRGRGHDPQAHPPQGQGPRGPHHEAHLPHHGACRRRRRIIGDDHMGQKVHPTGIRLGIVKDHNSVWYAEGKDYARQLVSDLEIRAYIEKRLAHASVSRIVIERPAQTARITIYTARPGIVIGKRGEDVDRLRRELANLMGVPVHVNIEEVRKPDLDAKLTAMNVAQQLERRVMFRRAMKRAVQNAMRECAKVSRVQVIGRLSGAVIARSDWYRAGRVPPHTPRADISYATNDAKTAYGSIGVKIWMLKGEILGSREVTATADAGTRARSGASNYGLD